MNEQTVVLFTYFVLAAFIGFEVVSNVPTILHTPLMSGSNAIHGIILVGSLLIVPTRRRLCKLCSASWQCSWPLLTW